MISFCYVLNTVTEEGTVVKWAVSTIIDGKEASLKMCDFPQSFSLCKAIEAELSESIQMNPEGKICTQGAFPVLWTSQKWQTHL